MFKYFLRRILSLIPKLLAMTLVVFLVMNLLPGDAITRSVPPDVYRRMTQTQIEELRESLGLNKPLLVQYFSWLGKFLKGDFGYSQSSGANIAQMVKTRLPQTMELTFFALVIAGVLGILFGYVSALKQNTAVDYGNTVLSIVGISVPAFFFGLVFIIFFALKLKWFPTGGRMKPGFPSFIDRLPYMIMPATCLAISLIATLSRYTRSSMLDVMGKEYVNTRRSKGLSEANVNFRHIFRNAISPVSVILVMRLPMLVSGTVVIENVFNYSGMGDMLLAAISEGDMTVVMVTTMIVAAVTLVASTLVDVVTAMLDPRVRFEK